MSIMSSWIILTQSYELLCGLATLLLCIQLAFYGLSNIMLASQAASARLNNEYTNINSIGMACAISCVIQFSELQYKSKGKWTSIFMIPAIVVIAATQSRKALVFAIGGVFALLIIKTWTTVTL